MILKSFLIFGALVATCSASYSIPVPVLVPELYRDVKLEDCGVEFVKEIETPGLAGKIAYHVTKEEMQQTDEADCTLRLMVPENIRIALWVTEGALVDCKSTKITVIDTSTGDVMNDLCEAGEESTVAAHLSTGRSIDIKVRVQDTVEVKNDTIFEASYLAFKAVDDSIEEDCYVCEKQDGNVNDSLCIDPRLKCDSVRNCLGEYKDDEAFTVTRDEHCTFVCNITGLDLEDEDGDSQNGTKTKEYIVNGIHVCNVFEDCPNGDDEDVVLCARDEIFGPLGLAGGIIIILCAVLLIIVIALGVNKRKQDAAKAKKRDAKKYSKGEEPVRGDAV
ncbi:uncharacterized protein [Ptychodera flava]|uniref:uncharacterized protein n=1 Tax=Ptychodera flava TaxID=63121 RepID=UPI00396A30F3